MLPRWSCHRHTCCVFEMGAARFKRGKVYQLHMLAGAVTAKGVELARANQARLQGRHAHAHTEKQGCNVGTSMELSAAASCLARRAQLLLLPSGDDSLQGLPLSLLLLHPACLTALTPKAVHDLSRVPTLLCLLTLYTIT